MRIVRWGAAAAAALTACVPAVAEAATPSTSAPAATPSNPVPQAVSSVTGSMGQAPQPASTSAPKSSSDQVKSQDTTVTQPAPAGTADAYAAKVGGVAAVSHTSTSVSGSSGSATADPLELGGSTPPSSHFGGTQTGSGHTSGSLFDTGTTPAGRLAVTPWSASVQSSGSGGSANALADIVLLDLGNPGSQQSASLRVLQSQSSSSWTSQASSGDSSSDGAILDLGGPSGLAVDVLHSQASSSGAGSSYLLSVNGNQIGSSSQANGQCSLTLPSLLSLECLTASGGTSTNSAGDTIVNSGGGVLAAAIGPSGSGLTAGLVQAASTSGKAPASAPAVTPAVSSPASSQPAAVAPPAAAPAQAPAAVTPAASSSLPFTGANIGLLLSAAAAMAGAGAGLVIVARRRGRSAPVSA